MNALLKKVMQKMSGTDSENPSLDDLLDRSDVIFSHVARSPILPATDSKERHTFGFGSPFETMSLAQILRVMPTMLREQRSFRTSMRLAREYEPGDAASAPAGLAAEIAELTRGWGAAEVGVVDVPEHAVFRDRVAPLPTAIVFTGEMDRSLMKTAPSFAGMREVVDAYGRTGVIANRLAAHLRAGGYNAIPGHSMGGTVDYPLLGELAGLGKLGRSGLLISRTFGVSQRIAVVFTDLTGLEMPQKESYEWVWDFCETCGKCIEACPVDALHDEFITDEFGQPTSTDGDRCLPYFGAHWGCSICVGVCPFTRADFSGMKAAWERRSETGAS